MIPFGISASDTLLLIVCEFTESVKVYIRKGFYVYQAGGLEKVGAKIKKGPARTAGPRVPSSGSTYRRNALTTNVAISCRVRMLSGEYVPPVVPFVMRSSRIFWM